MVDENNLRQGLYLQGISVDETDITYIQNILFTINQAEAALKEFPDLKKLLPITIVDKGELTYE